MYSKEKYILLLKEEKCQMRETQDRINETLLIDIIPDYIKQRNFVLHEFICKTNKLIEDITCYEKNMDNLMLLTSTLRYVLEQLIDVKLFKRNRKNIYLFYLATIEQKEKKIDAMIKAVKNDISMCEKLDSMEKEKKTEYDKEINDKKFELKSSTQQNKEDILSELKKLMNDRHNKCNNYFYELLQNEGIKYSLYYENIVNNGFSFQAHLLEKQVLKKYIEQKSEIDRQKKEVIKGWRESSEISKIINIDSSNKVQPKQGNMYLKWVDKAELLEIKDEYNVIYEQASSLLHCTPYSIFTPPELMEKEKQLALLKIYKYVKEIGLVIKEISEIEKINIVYISEEA